MHTVVRSYSGPNTKVLFDVLEKNKADVEATLKGVKGLITYTLARTGDGGITITVCEDEAGADESVRVAREWIQKNASNVGAAAPTITERQVVVL
jgi:restriction endonuclease Mrr